MLSKEELPDFIDRMALKGQLVKILDIARSGLKDRGRNEEHYLDALYERAEKLTNPAKQMLEGIRKGRQLVEFIKDYSAL